MVCSFLGFQSALLRPLVLGRMGRAGDRATIEKAQQLFRAHVDKGDKLNPDLRNMVSKY